MSGPTPQANASYNAQQQQPSSNALQDTNATHLANQPVTLHQPFPITASSRSVSFTRSNFTSSPQLLQLQSDAKRQSINPQDAQEAQAMYQMNASQQQSGGGTKFSSAINRRLSLLAQPQLDSQLTVQQQQQQQQNNDAILNDDALLASDSHSHSNRAPEHRRAASGDSILSANSSIGGILSSHRVATDTESPTNLRRVSFTVASSSPVINSSQHSNSQQPQHANTLMPLPATSTVDLHASAPHNELMQMARQQYGSSSTSSPVITSAMQDASQLFVATTQATPLVSSCQFIERQNRESTIRPLLNASAPTPHSSTHTTNSHFTPSAIFQQQQQHHYDQRNTHQLRSQPPMQQQPQPQQQQQDQTLIGAQLFAPSIDSVSSASMRRIRSSPMIKNLTQQQQQHSHRNTTRQSIQMLNSPTTSLGLDFAQSPLSQHSPSEGQSSVAVRKSKSNNANSGGGLSRNLSTNDLPQQQQQQQQGKSRSRAGSVALKAARRLARKASAARLSRARKKTHLAQLQARITVLHDQLNALNLSNQPMRPCDSVMRRMHDEEALPMLRTISAAVGGANNNNSSHHPMLPLCSPPSASASVSVASLTPLYGSSDCGDGLDSLRSHHVSSPMQEVNLASSATYLPAPPAQLASGQSIAARSNSSTSASHGSGSQQSHSQSQHSQLSAPMQIQQQHQFLSPYANESMSEADLATLIDSLILHSRKRQIQSHSYCNLLRWEMLPPTALAFLLAGVTKPKAQFRVQQNQAQNNNDINSPKKQQQSHDDAAAQATHSPVSTLLPWSSIIAQVCGIQQQQIAAMQQHQEIASMALQTSSQVVDRLVAVQRRIADLLTSRQKIVDDLLHHIEPHQVATFIANATANGSTNV